jgi:hypothetical protein
MPRSVKRKSEMANIAPDPILQAVRAARIENRSIRAFEDIRNFTESDIHY